MPRTFSQLCIAFGVLLTATVAWACPYCAGREESSGELVLMFGMILLPFGVAGVVYKVIKRVSTHEELGHSTPDSSSGGDR